MSRGMRVRRLLIAGCAVAGTVTVAVAGTIPASASSSCKPRKEASGCVLKNAVYSLRDSRFAVSLGKGEASSDGTVTCVGSDGTSGTSNVLYGSYPELVVMNPKVGKSYKRTLHITRDLAAGQAAEGTVVLTVNVMTAKQARITYVEDVDNVLQNGTSKCHGRTSALLKRVS